MMRRDERIVKNELSLMKIAVGFICLCILISCKDLFDANQVQMVTEPSAFKEFKLPPREVVYGPYSMITADSNAIIAWEEKKYR
jgi:hypothetical protein